VAAGRPQGAKVDLFTSKTLATFCLSDFIVVGLGAMGSSTAYHLAKRSAKVLGLEAFTPAHEKGSSDGESRIIRQAYFEDPAYVPLVLRAYELWNQLEAESDEELLNIITSNAPATIRLHSQ
jgi:glycine/D-amino acid oxidase-like deaminating enzyme